MLSKNEAFLRLLSEIYDASLDETLWTPCLQTIARVLESNVVGISLGRRPTEPGVPEGITEPYAATTGCFSSAIGLTAESHESYFKDWMPLDELTAKAVAISCTEHRDALRRQEIAEDFTVERSDFYQGFMKHLDYFHTLGSVGLSPDHAHIYALAVNRPKRTGIYSEEEEAFIASLAPHLRRSISIHLKLQGVRLAESVHSAATEATGKACFLVDGSMRLLWADRAGDQLMKKNHGVSVRDGRFRLASAADEAKLSSIVMQTAEGIRSEPGSVLAETDFAVNAGSNSARLRISVLPKPPALGPGIPLGVLILVQREAVTSTLESELQQRCQLTPAEFRVAKLLLRGFSIREISELLQRSTGTIRNQLKVVLHKTGSRRQSEFVAKYASLLDGGAD